MPIAPDSQNADTADLDALWMPFTGNRQFKADPRIIVSGEGVWYTDAAGRKIFDGLSGLWTCGLGHGRTEICDAISRQAKTLDYSPAFHYGHPTAFKLAQRLRELCPGELDYAFLTNSGSESIDTALKMARAYWQLQGKAAKTKIIGRAKAYHGVSFGGISVGGLAPNRKLFGQGIDAAHLPHTLLPENDFSRGMPGHGEYLAEELNQLIAIYDASTIAAVIVEPFSGSAGVIVPPQGYLQRLREICSAHDILLIFDEVITGFGRAGAMTGAHAFEVTPDIITFAKQMSNGTQPIGAVVCSRKIYNGFMDNAGPDYLPEFPHGYTYSGHPIACAAALASFDLLVEEHMIERVADLAPYFENAVHSLRGSEHITDIRNYGLAAGISLEPYPGETGRKPFDVAMKCWQKGFYVRAGADSIQLAPPFISSREQLDALTNALGESIRELGASSNADR